MSYNGSDGDNSRCCIIQLHTIQQQTLQVAHVSVNHKPKNKTAQLWAEPSMFESCIHCCYGDSLFIAVAHMWTLQDKQLMQGRLRYVTQRFDLPQYERRWYGGTTPLDDTVREKESKEKRERQKEKG